MPRPRSLLDLAPRRVCLVKPSSLGDVVHALPVLSALRDRWPDAHIAWVVNRGLRGLIDGHPALDEVIPFDRGSVGYSPKGLLAFGRFLQSLRSREFDLAIDLQGLLRSGLMTAGTGAKVRVGMAEAREGAPRFYTHRVATVADRPVHMIDRMLKVAAELGAAIDRPRHVLPPDEDADRWADATLAGVPGPRLMLNLGARWLTKRWPPEHFAALARRAHREFGAGLVAVGSPEDRPLIDLLKPAVAPWPLLDLCGRTDLRQLAAISRRADVFLSNDTGPLHLAVAAGARTVGIYTCTDPRKTGPYGNDAISVVSHIACAASAIKTCGHLGCMSELTPDRAWPALRRQLERAVASRSRVA